MTSLSLHQKIVRDVVERAAPAPPGSGIPGGGGGGGGAALPAAAFYERVLKELADLGWARVCGMDGAMRSLQIRARDPAGREHVLSLQLPADYPFSAPQVSAALPERFVLSTWDNNGDASSSSSSLLSAVKEFEGVLGGYQALFSALDDMDAHCWVLEPERPLRSDVHRRIAIGRHASLRIELDARAPMRAVPDCRFLGSEAAVAPLRARLNENMRDWVTSGDLLPRANLEAVLGLRLPRAPEREVGDGEGATEMELGLECGICYAYRLDDKVPEVACDRAECARPYHRPCIVEWLKTLPDTRQSFETLFGACPYCEQHISVSMTEG